MGSWLGVSNRSLTPVVPVLTGIGAGTSTNDTAASTASAGSPLTALWPDPLPDGTQGIPYSYTLTASGGVLPYTFAATGLPAGLSINPATGAITGTPTTVGSMAAVTASVTDSSS